MTDLKTTFLPARPSPCSRCGARHRPEISPCRSAAEHIGGATLSTVRGLRDAVWACDIGPTAKLVALGLLEYWPRRPSLESLSERCGLSSLAVRTALIEIESAGLIGGDGPGTTAEGMIEQLRST